MHIFPDGFFDYVLAAALADDDGQPALNAGPAPAPSGENTDDLRSRLDALRQEIASAHERIDSELLIAAQAYLGQRASLAEFAKEVIGLEQMLEGKTQLVSQCPSAANVEPKSVGIENDEADQVRSDDDDTWRRIAHLWDGTREIAAEIACQQSQVDSRRQNLNARCRELAGVACDLALPGQ